MQEYDVIIVGAGPAGLGASIEARKFGARVLLLDENGRPGGQLYKQTHKFFGSSDHYAGIRGFKIGEVLLQTAKDLGVELQLNTKVWGIFPDLSITAVYCGKSLRCRAKIIILATGASENALGFPGCTLPGVMTAGAVQTLVNVQHVLPAENYVMIGSGNVGLIVSYQLLQAGANVKAVLEASSSISGYGVHASKIKRAGIPIRLRYTVKRAIGRNSLEAVEIVRLDECFNAIANTEETIECDGLCLAVGLSPRIDLAVLSKCKMLYSTFLGGVLPWHNEDMETSHPNILIAGDLAGIEEASTALDEGRLAGLRAANKIGLCASNTYIEQKSVIINRLVSLRDGPFGERRRFAKASIWRNL